MKTKTPREARLEVLLVKALETIEYIEDTGPPEEGYQSRELQDQITSIRDELNEQN